MPLFEYRCLICDKLFETLVTGIDEVVSCNICDSVDVKKVFSVFGVSNNDKSAVEDSTFSNSCKSTCSCCN
ncbi:MAG: FmdB family zinc ribbon protein [Thermodesulfobacteriota bacterium]